MTWYDRIIERLFSPLVEARVAARLASVTARVDDSPGWGGLSAGPADRPWADRAADLTDALEAWRANFLIRRIVALIRSYVVGQGIHINSHIPEVNDFVQQFWSHPQNHIDRRLGAMCDELVRAGELFPVLFTNKVDGMSYVRFVPASRIIAIETAANDYEVERKYHEMDDGTGAKEWFGVGTARAFRPSPQRQIYPPLMLHFAVNRPIGATRGEGDLGPVLPWALRYSEWLKDRVRLNRLRTRHGLLDVQIADDSVVEQKRLQLQTSNPVDAGIYVHGPGEELQLHKLDIQAGQAKDDGLILRLAVATGSGTALHYMGEGETVNYATAKEMGEPTSRFFGERQKDFVAFLEDLVAAAYRRKVGLGLAAMPEGGDLRLYANVTEVARQDNLNLAQAAAAIVGAIHEMIRLGIADRDTAARLAYKFAGEALTEDEIQEILRNARPEPDPDPDPSAQGDGREASGQDGVGAGSSRPEAQGDEP
jgi:hypothetical protein